MNFWLLLRHAGTIIQVFRVLKEIVERTAKSEHKIPSCADSRLAVAQVRRLLESGVIDIPSVDEKEIAKAIGEIESNIVCAVDLTHRNVAAYGSPKGVQGLTPPEVKSEEKA